MTFTIIGNIYIKYIIQSVYWAMVIFGFAIVAAFLLFLLINTIYGTAIIISEFIDWATNKTE